MGNSLKIEGVEIKEELGGGSYGVVYKAKWNGKFAAVKVLREDMFWCHPKAVEDFKRECEFVRVLKHPNIVEMFEVLFPENRSPVLIMELMFCDLHSYYKDSKSSPKIALDEVIRIMLDVGEGLKFLHDREDPIVHRDIKSNNILLDTKQRAKIADLGQAKEFPGLGFGARVSATPVPGTTVYMAPETFPCSRRQSQVDRHRVDYGAEIDVFSFGVVLLEVIVGHFPCPRPLFVPYTRDGNLVPEHTRRKKELEEMGSLHPLRDIVLQCLENDPSRRPTINEVSRDLKTNDGSQKRIELKIAFLGNSGVGKSLLIKRYIDKDIPQEFVKSTIGVELHPVPLEIGNQLVILRIVDPAGQERFDSIAPSLFRGSHGAFLVYDISEPRTFKDLPKHMNFIGTSCSENVKVMLIGNKKDLKRCVEFERAKSFADLNEMEYLEVSAMTLENLEEMFERLASSILDSLDTSDVRILERSVSRVHLTDGEIVPEYIRRSEDLEEMGLDDPLLIAPCHCFEIVPEDRPSAAEIVETLQKFSTTVEGKSSDGEIVPEYIRRSEDLEEMGLDHPFLDPAYHCFEIVPEDRPSAAEIVETLQKFSTTVEGKSSENELRKDSTMTTPKFKENQGSVERIVNYEGGILFAEDVQVICPDGAISKLDDHVVIKIVLEKPSTHCDMIVKNGLENEVMFIAPVINLQPNGQVFKKPVTLQTRLTTETDAFRLSDVLILHGTQATDGKIVWEDITHQSKIDLEKKELKVEINQFSRIAALLRLTSILAKNVVTRLNLWGFNYTLSVLFKDNHPHSPFGELALVFMSHDVYHETCYREHPSSVLTQLKGNGYEKLCSIDSLESNRIYNNENLRASLILGQDYELTDGQLESTDFIVDSSTWWSTGHVIKWSLKGTDGVRILCGKIGIEGQYGHILRETFCGLDTCEYVRRLLRVEGSILNLVPIARKLEVPEEAMNEVIKSWQNDEEQLKIILQYWSKGQEERCMDNPSMLRNTLQGLNSEDCEVDERGKMHINHLRELAFEIQSLNREDPHLMEYFTNQIRTLCRDSILKDCCIELDADVSVENYPRFLSIRQQVTEDVALKLETICSSSTRSINEDFFSIVPFLIQAIKDIFRKENHLIVQNGLKGLPKESVIHHESKVRDAFLNKDIFRLMYEVCGVLESLCLNNCEKHSTEEIENWSESLGIWNMSKFLEKFFQSRQDSKLHKRLQLFSRSLRRISEDVRKIKEIEMRYFYNVSLNLIKFATFNPSKLVRFEITDSANSPVTCYSEAIKYDRPHDTFSQQFEIRKESEDELQLGAIARVHVDGRIRKVGAFESVIVLPSSSEWELARCPISTLPVAVKTERTDSGDLRVVLSSTRRDTISEALCVLQRELRDDIVDGEQVDITESHLTVRCFVEAVGMVRLRLLYKWRSEAISVDSKDFVAIGESFATDASTSASDSGVTNSSSPLEAELAALSIASRPGDKNGNFVMDPSAIEIIQTHARQQGGPLELHLHQTIMKGHVCVTGENTSLHMEMPETAQRFLQAGLCAPSQKSITAVPSSNEEAVSELQENQSIDMEEIPD